MFWSDKLKEAINTKKQAVVELLRSEFPLDCYDDSTLAFNMKPIEDGKMAVSGIFRHSFCFEESAKILRKQSVLRNVFQNIELPYEIIGELGVESFEHGKIIMTLPQKCFEIGAASEMFEYCYRFIRTVAIIHAVESYEE